jgi:hypothetical protein
VRETLKTWFSLSRPVRQSFYAASGFGLVAFKYTVVGGLETECGKFRLISPAADRTRLEDSTWHRNNLFPQLYWNLRSDTLIHRTPGRVLDHVKRGSEGMALASP